MKPVDLKRLRPDPIAMALRKSGKDVIAVTGYICASDDATIALSATRGVPSFTEYPRSAVIAAFEDEESGRATLLVDANAPVRDVTTTTAKGLRARDNAGQNQGASCNSQDGKTEFCSCPVGEKCVTTWSTCDCKKTSQPGFSSGFGDIAWLDNLVRLGRALDLP